MAKSTAILEILILMAVAAIIGYLLGKERGCSACDCGDTKEQKKAPVANTKSVAPAISSDDLKKIEGIGPAIEKLLNAEGIKSFTQLAEMKIEKIKNILDAAGPQFQMHDGETWAEQARLARDGKWVEFNALTDKLKNGKHV